jgi:membrane-bound serine protease (ClpP class)
MDTTYLTLGAFLIGAGLLLLLADLFLTSGILLVLALGSVAVGVALIFQYDATTGLWALLGVMGALPALAGLVVYLWPRTPMGRGLFLPPSSEEDTLAALPVNEELTHLKGRFGVTLSALRPAGVVDFDGRRVDTITEGMMVGPGQWVRCVDVRAGKVVVRPVDKPNVGELETAIFS